MYSVLVFEEDDKKLRMATVLPNFGPELDLKIGDIGFATLEYYKAGEQFYNRKTDSYQTIKFTNVYLKKFVKDNKKEEIIL